MKTVKILGFLVFILTLTSIEKDNFEPREEIIELNEEIDYKPIEYIGVDSFLSSPAEGSEKTINVVVINYVPTNDKGKTVNQNTFPFAREAGVNPKLPVEE